jgi:DNA-binding transcriptional MerR regulator
MTTQTAAALLGVAPSTLRSYIKQKVLDDPGLLRVGRRLQRGYTEEYIAQARRQLQEGGEQ